MSPRRTIRLDLEFDGSQFLGWQRQGRGRTVQGELRRALRRFLQQDVTPVGSGRTDAGTHALGLVAHLHTCTSHDATRFVRALNALLPPDLCVLRALDVEAGFHARYSACGKRYRYRILSRCRPLRRRQAWVRPWFLDLKRMQEAADLLVGRHLFRAFCNAHPPPDHFECHVEEAAWRWDDGEWIFEIEGNRFLRHMVRILVGTLVEVGEGKRSVPSFERLLTQPGERADAGATAPAKGLCLLGVRYDEADGGPSGALRPQDRR